MRNSLLAFIALISITGYTPKIMASDIGGIGGASRTAELIELHGAATYTAIQRKTLTEYVDAGETTGFIFDESSFYCVGLECSRPNVSTWFQIMNEEKDGCNSTIYHAEEVQPKQGAPRMLTVADHSERICDDYRPFKWEVQMQGPTDRFFGGNPSTI
jgi:hypothetical protein